MHESTVMSATTVGMRLFDSLSSESAALECVGRPANGAKHKHETQGRTIAAKIPDICAGRSATPKKIAHAARPTAAMRRSMRASFRSLCSSIVCHQRRTHSAENVDESASPPTSAIESFSPNSPSFARAAMAAPAADKAKRYPRDADFRLFRHAVPIRMATMQPASPEMVRGSCSENAKSKSEKKARLASERRANATMQLGPMVEHAFEICSRVLSMGSNYNA